MFGGLIENLHHSLDLLKNSRQPVKIKKNREITNKLGKATYALHYDPENFEM